ncbi:MAG: hypothetical protein IIY72_07135, partial [Solobacterium sp.]|nr:hypothetical protein [Solobacterium sp.]
MSTNKKKRTAPAGTSGKARKNPVHRDMSTVNIVLTVFTALADLGVVYTMLNTTRFATLSKPAFILEKHQLAFSTTSFVTDLSTTLSGSPSVVFHSSTKLS